MDLVARTLRFAARSLGKAPGFSASAILVLTLAIGASAAVFALVDAVLLQPLPFREPDRLAVVWEKNVTRGRDRNVTSPLNFHSWREESRTFSTIEALTFGPRLTLGGNGEPERVRVTFVTAGLLSQLGVAPAIGRGFAPDENLPGKTGVALLSHELFVRRFGGERSAIGRDLVLDGDRRQVVGVLPKGLNLFTPADVVVPLTLDPAKREWGGRYLVVTGRLASGATLASAQAEMSAIASRLAARYPDKDTGWTVNVVSLKEQLTGDLKPALLVLFAAVGVVLLIAATNVANLVLARTAARRHELGVRVALGASTGRIFGQLAAECALLAAGGVLGGLLLASAALSGIAAAAPKIAPLAASARISPRVVGFALLVALAAALAASLAALLTAIGKDVVRLLKRGSASPRHASLRSVLVVAETALSVVLLVGAGLLARSVATLLSVDPGFSAERGISFALSLPEATYETPEAKVAFLEAAVGKAATQPGVAAAGTISVLPLDGAGSATSFTVAGAPEPAAGEKPVADVRAISGEYFKAMEIPVLAGAGLPRSPVAKGAPIPLVVNRTLARQHFGDDAAAIGRRLHVDIQTGLDGEIAAVVGDVRLAGLDAEPRATIYWDARSSPFPFFSVVARTSADPSAVAPALLAQLRALDPGLAITVRSLPDIVGASLGKERSLALLVAVFSAAALLLTAVGLYGVVSYLVAQRTSEIGVRIALGASPAGVARFVLRGGGGLVGLGAAVGLAVAFALAPLASKLLFGVAPRDPVTFAAVPAILAAVALLACAVPAVRASRVDPIVALRAE